jgi:hypothetical protein
VDLQEARRATQREAEEALRLAVGSLSFSLYHTEDILSIVSVVFSPYPSASLATGTDSSQEEKRQLDVQVAELTARASSLQQQLSKAEQMQKEVETFRSRLEVKNNNIFQCLRVLHRAVISFHMRR